MHCGVVQVQTAMFYVHSFSAFIQGPFYNWFFIHIYFSVTNTKLSQHTQPDRRLHVTRIAAYTSTRCGTTRFFWAVLSQMPYVNRVESRQHMHTRTAGSHHHVTSSSVATSNFWFAGMFLHRAYTRFLWVQASPLRSIQHWWLISIAYRYLHSEGVSFIRRPNEMRCYVLVVVSTQCILSINYAR